MAARKKQPQIPGASETQIEPLASGPWQLVTVALARKIPHPENAASVKATRPQAV